MVELLFGVLIEGLKLWNSKESTKYVDEVYELQKEWIAEYEKPKSSRNNNDLDHIEQRLHLIGKLFVSSAGTKKV